MRPTANSAIKYGILTAILAMFLDAAVGHGLFWKNDSYWTYWITDTLLIITIITIGSTIVGIGVWQGFLLIAFQTLTLEIYYQFLSPVALPQEPYWLSHYEIWTTGLPVHYLVYLAGYLLALWIWRRKERMKHLIASIPAWKISIYSLITAMLILILDGIITQAFLLGGYPGFTFLLQRLIITFVFLMVWNCYVGLDLKGIISATVLLSLQWIAYTMYLGPVGLPTNYPVYLSYQELWLLSFPGALLSVLAGLLIMKRFRLKEGNVR